MQVPGLVVERLRDSAEVLETSPVEYVQASVPTYEVSSTGLTFLHPLVDGPQEIGEPYRFHTFNLSASANNRSINFRLTPPTDMKVSLPIVTPEKSNFLKYLPKVGFAALRGQILEFDKNDCRFFLLAEDDEGNAEQVLEMPSNISVFRLAMQVASQVHIKATMATLIDNKKIS